MTELRSTTERDEPTQMAEAFRAAGVEVDETPQQAAERIWKETKHDPVETMRQFDEWGRQNQDRMLWILGAYWGRAVRSFLERKAQHPNGTGVRVRVEGWKHAAAFYMALRKKVSKDSNDRRKSRADAGPEVLSHMRRREHNDRCKTYYRRKRDGIKVVPAEVSVTTGQLVNLIDKEYGPFKHIMINNLRLPEVTTPVALEYCDKRGADVRFIRALCHLIPDPRKPIGEQWTPEIIREAKEAARRMEAA